jgi:hypothetical protein
MRFFGAADRRSLYFLATWRKGGVQRAGAFREFIGDACHGRAPRIRFGTPKWPLAGTRNFQRACCYSTWSKIRSPTGFDRCSAASGDRAVRRYPDHACALIPSKQPATTTTASCGELWAAHANGDVHEKIACGICASTPSLIGSRQNSVAGAGSNLPTMDWNDRAGTCPQAATEVTREFIAS